MKDDLTRPTRRFASPSPNPADLGRAVQPEGAGELSAEDIVHYQKIVRVLGETIRLMEEVDEVITVHGGWPIK